MIPGRCRKGSYCSLYLELKSTDVRQANAYEIKSADWFYEFARVAQAEPENVKAISKKFLKIATD